VFFLFNLNKQPPEINKEKNNNKYNII